MAGDPEGQPFRYGSDSQRSDSQLLHATPYCCPDAICSTFQSTDIPCYLHKGSATATFLIKEYPSYFDSPRVS